jgi:FkbM family methyltransferase
MDIRVPASGPAELRGMLKSSTSSAPGVEFKEIEAALERHRGVAETVVTAGSDGFGSRRLWAYVVPRCAASSSPYFLPSGLAVFHLNKDETEHLYRQIFESNIYLRHGIALPGEACVLDVGANIGLFTLFVHCVCEHPRVLAFEPSPPAFEELRRNTELYGLAVELLPCAASDREGTAPFTIYPRASVMSGLYADPVGEERLFRTFAQEQLHELDDPQLLAEVLDEMAAGRFTVKVVERPLRTVSSVMKEHGIERVDLLKVDAEKSELDIFSGLTPEDWSKILQVVTEVHSDEGLVAVVTLLKAQGFAVITEQDATMRATGIHHVYARRHRPADGQEWLSRPRRVVQPRAAASVPPLTTEELCESLWDLLRRELPESMLPAGITLLDELPRLPDGTLDCARLPEPDTHERCSSLLPEGSEPCRSAQDPSPAPSWKLSEPSKGVSEMTTATRDLVAAGPEVCTGFLGAEGIMPLVVEPAGEGLDPARWAGQNVPFIESHLLRYGALLFRGFGLSSVGDFEAFAAAICPSLYGDYGDLPRESLGEKVYESTPYPPDKAILFHNESSHMPRWPLKQWFFCVQPARERGETPIVDCRQIYERLDPSVRRRFEEKKLMYVRNFVEGLDVSWTTFFRTDDRAVVASSCRSLGMECEWTEDDGLRLRQIAPAVVRHPKTGDKSFFNQLQLHHISYLDPELRESLLLLYGEEGLPRNVYYGDGTPIEDELVREIEQLYWDAAVQFPWQQGDVIMVDNMLVAHARNPYGGPRKIVVAMGELVGQEDLA